ncbi:MAG: bifunctional UDP-N-acetylmuramoyl-tripeptide:D-alanyl-D-alanine ligase/alanine racemase [Chitinophagales bacterium]
MKISRITKAVNGTLLQSVQNTDIQHLLFDSRKITFPKNALFFAIKSSSRNGHHFIAAAYQKGVRNFIISRNNWQITDYPEANFILVPNTIEALQNLAAEHRSNFTYPIIGITGSNGKTVVKEWLYQLLWQDFHIVRSPKSYNSQIGVPLSVWQMTDQHNLGFFEAGISEVGEMEKLEKIIQPTIGIFTNIGAAHSKGFESDGQKVREKLELFRGVDVLIYCRDYEEVHEYIQPFRREVLLPAKKHLPSPLQRGNLCNNFPFEGGRGDVKPIHEKVKTLTWSKSRPSKKSPQAPKPTLKITLIHKKSTFTHIEAQYQNQAHQIQIPFTDEASIENAIHCWLLLLYFNDSGENITAKMLQLSPIAMRLELKQGNNNCSIINDSYNNDLHSLGIALDFLKQQRQHPKHTVILSDILQSGQNHQKLYRQVAQLLQQKNIQRLVGIGEKITTFRAFFEGMETKFFPTTKAFLQQTPTFRDESILVKGARTFAFEKIANRLSQKAHSTVLEINLNAIVHNLKVYRQLLQKNTKMMVMVKALSYGSGSFEVANLLQYYQVDYLGVAYTDEGVALRKAGITLPIMVLNPSPSSFDALLQYDIEPEIYSLWQLQQLDEHLQHTSVSVEFPISIHLKLETGMNRLGFEESELPDLIQHLQHNPQFEVVSILSHLSASDEAQHDGFSREQMRRYKVMHNYLQENLFFAKPPIRHILNSTGIIRFPDCHKDMVRLGLGLYGIDGANILQSQLQCVSALKTYISQIKEVPPSETVGYARKGQLSKTSKIATVNIGYGDGLQRRLSNGRGKMWICGKLAPIVGNVCMDMTMLDVTHIEGVKAGDEVEVFGEHLPVQQVAEWLETISYEVLTGVSGRVKRVYFQE